MGLFHRPTLRQRLLIIMPYALSSASTATALTLSQFQEIQGFSQVCTTAYNTPLPGCTSNDFRGSNACSSTCASGILSVQSLINQACKGTAADQNTLIGLFFLNRGVQALCPSVSDTPATSASQPAKTTQAPSSTSSVDGADATETSDSSSSNPTTTLSSMARPAPTVSSSSTGIIFAPTESAPKVSSTAPSAAAASNNPNSFGGDVDPFASSATRSINSLLGITLGVSLCIGTFLAV